MIPWQWKFAWHAHRVAILCGWLGWHRLVFTGYDGMSVHAECARCGHRGMVDSQGNLF